jgi:hypothetical protein
MNLNKFNTNYALFGGVVLVLVVVFLIGKKKGETETEQKEVDVTVNIKDENGQAVTYNPNELLARLNKGLTTRYYFDFSERCDPIKELYSLDSVRFMAAVRAYKAKYSVDIQVHMKSCNVDCNVNSGVNALSYFDLIYKRIDNLKDIIT